jgi:hypothetical protein
MTRRQPFQASSRATYVSCPCSLLRGGSPPVRPLTPAASFLCWSPQHTQNKTDGPKRIILNPSPEQRREESSKTFEEGEVFGVDVLITSAPDGKNRAEEARTTIFKKNDITYQLKMQTSRSVFAEIKKKVGCPSFAPKFSILSIDELSPLPFPQGRCLPLHPPVA